MFLSLQLLVALDALEYLGIVHSDIKPDNIMVVNAESEPLRVKLIDFGLAFPTSKIWRGMQIQNESYR